MPSNVAMVRSPEASERPHAGPVLAAAVAVFALLVAFAPLGCYDVWWHIANGREVVAGRGIPRTNLYSFTHPDYEVTPTHWLFGVAAYLVHELAGPNGLLVTRAALVAAAFALAYLLARRRGAGAVAAALVVAVACLASRRRFLMRPHLVTMLGLAAFAYLIERFRGERRKPPQMNADERRWEGLLSGVSFLSAFIRVHLRLLWPVLVIPPLAALWANFHAGCLFGVGLVGMLAAGEGATWLLARSRLGPGDPPRGGDPSVLSARRRAVLLGGAALASAVAVMASPVGWGVYTYNVWHLGLGGVVPLREFRSSLPAEKPLFYLLLVTGVAALVADRKRARAGEALAFIVFAAVAVYAVRGVPNFAIVASPIVATRLSSLWRRLTQGGRERQALARLAALARRVPTAAVSVCLLGIPFAMHLAGRRTMGFGLKEHFYPVGAAAFVEREIESPRAFNDLVAGGYLAWKWYPKRQIFIDGRTNAYPPELFRELYGPNVRVTPELIERVLREYDVNCALLLRYMFGNRFWPVFDLDRWAVVFAEDAALVLVRRTPLNRELIEEYENRLGELGGARAEHALSRWFADRGPREAYRAASAAERALTAEKRSGDVVFNHRERADLNFRMGVAAQLMREPEKAVPFYVKALELRYDWPEAHLNLGFALLDVKKPKLARLEFEWALDEGSRRSRAFLGLAGSLEALGLVSDAVSAYRKYLAEGGGRPRDIEKVRARLESLDR